MTRSGAGGSSGTSTPRTDGFIETVAPSTTNFSTLLASQSLREHSNGKSHSLLNLNPNSTPTRQKRVLPRAHIAQRRLLGVDDHPVAEVIFFELVISSCLVHFPYLFVFCQLVIGFCS
jgi:hypothetical protein